MSVTILIVLPERQIAGNVEQALERAGFATLMARSPSEVRQQLLRTWVDVVLLDVAWVESDGSELDRRLMEDFPESRYLLVCDPVTLGGAIESTGGRAADYLAKPLSIELVVHAVRRALADRGRAQELRCLRSFRERGGIGLEPGAARSDSMRRVSLQARRASEEGGPVLLLGEPGVGRQALAQWIHTRSLRGDRPLLVLGCARRSAEPLDVVLFGRRRDGANDPARRAPSLVELADAGSLLLTDVDRLDESSRARLLQYLERAPAAGPRLMATGAPGLVEAAEAGAFEPGLLEALDVQRIDVPALRDRFDDVRGLVEAYLTWLAAEQGMEAVPSLSAAAWQALASYEWPGNLPELRSVIERAVRIAGGEMVHAGHLALPRKRSNATFEVPFVPGTNLHAATRSVARHLIREALRRARTKTGAAELLGISRHALNHQIKVLRIRS